MSSPPKGKIQELVNRPSHHFWCSKRCTKYNYNRVPLLATIAVMLQRIFETLHSITSFVKLVSQKKFRDRLMKKNDWFSLSQFCLPFHDKLKGTLLRERFLYREAASQRIQTLRHKFQSVTEPQRGDYDSYNNSKLYETTSEATPGSYIVHTKCYKLQYTLLKKIATLR